MTQRLTPRILFERFGEEGARWLMANWGRHRVPALPPDHTARVARDAAIRAAVDAGASYGQVARRFGVSRTRAAQIAAVQS